MGRKSRNKLERTEPLGVSPASDASLLQPDFEAGSTANAAIAAVIVVAVFVLFFQVRSHQFLNYDDPIYVTDNTHVQAGLTGEGLAWALRSFDFNWHPLTWFTHMLDVQLFGVNAGAHVMVNVAIHAANAVLLFFLLLRLTLAKWRSAAVAALFAIHPLHVESVAWVAERKDVLCTLFALAALWFYVSFVRSRSRASYALMLAMFILGFMSKGMIVTLPFVMLLLDSWPLDRLELRDRATWKLPLLEKVPLFVLLVPAAIVTLMAQRAVSAVASTFHVPLSIRFANAAIAYAKYVAKIFWPVHLIIPYEYPRTISPANAIACALLVVAVTVAVCALHRRRYLATGWFLFVGMLVPVIGIVQIGPQAMADRYTHMPAIGIFIAMVWLVSDLVATSSAARTAAAGAFAIVLLACCVLTYRQVGYWRDSITLFRHTLSLAPTNVTALLNLADGLAREQRFEEALPHLELAAKERPGSDLTHAAFGNTLLSLGRLDRAREEFGRALQINPSNDASRVGLAKLEIASGRSSEAAALLAGGAGGNAPDALAMVAVAQGKLDEARSLYERALAANPSSASLHNDLAAVLARLDRNDEAVRHYQDALRLAPDNYDAHMNFGALLSRLERSGDAAAQFKSAAVLRPKSPEPLIYEALVHAGLGDFTQAIACIDRAMQVDPVNSNLLFTNAVRMPPRDTNLAEYRAFLESKHAESTR